MQHQNSTIKLRSVELPRGSTFRSIFALLLRAERNDTGRIVAILHS